jgi:hypothetical protein
MSLAQALGGFESGAFRIRTFELNGHTFKVKVPLTAEMEAMAERLKEPAPELIEKHYQNLTSGLDAEVLKAGGVEVLEDDYIIEGKSLRDLAKQKALAEKRIVEMFKLLVPADKEFDMATITYDMIDELFPFAIQLEVMENIAKTISPDYKERRGK